jgi:hypothetical protein
MSHEPTPKVEAPMIAGASATPWGVVQQRLANPEVPRTSWLATVRPDGGPHLMPIIAFWIDGAYHFVAGEGTQKGRNLTHEGRCVIGTGSTTLPSLDIVVEGHAKPVADQDAVRRVAEHLRSNNWPLEVRGAELHGPHAPTAGPPPYRIYRMVPSKTFGLPGMLGMEQFKPEDLPKPTRWEFAAD